MTVLYSIQILPAGQTKMVKQLGRWVISFSAVPRSIYPHDSSSSVSIVTFLRTTTGKDWRSISGHITGSPESVFGSSLSAKWRAGRLGYESA